MSIDIVIASVPLTEGNEPMMAPGYLKSILQVEGFSCTAVDLNAEFHDRVKDIDGYLYKCSRFGSVTDYASDPELDEEYFKVLSTEIDYQAKRLLDLDPEYIGLSLLSYYCQNFTKWLCVRLKQLAPDKKIILGGTGIAGSDLIKDNNKTYFCQELKSMGLIDHFINGDAEVSLVNLLRGKTTSPGIDNWTMDQTLDLGDYPYPDYTDYNFNLYDDPALPIIESQGCVQQCEFCDIIEFWKTYTYKKSTPLFDEMIYQSQKYNIYKFAVRNSLTNGNIREFSNWLSLIKEYNSKQPIDTQFQWRGYFIVRNKQLHPEQLWQLLSDSNATLYIGVETLVEKIRFEMRKKFTNEDLDYHLDMGQKYNVPLILLMMAASPNETREDFEFTKQWLRDRYRYAKNSVTGIFYSLASVLTGTEWDRKYQNNGTSTLDWTSEISKLEKLDYFNEITETCKPFNSLEFKDKQKKMDSDKVFAQKSTNKNVKGTFYNLTPDSKNE